MRTETQGEVVKWGFLKKEQARNMISKHGRKRGQGNKRKSLGISSEKRGTGTSSPFIYLPPPLPPLLPPAKITKGEKKGLRETSERRTKTTFKVQKSQKPHATTIRNTRNKKRKGKQVGREKKATKEKFKTPTNERTGPKPQTRTT